MALSERVFRDARSEVEQRIDESLRDKIDQFLELGRCLVYLLFPEFPLNWLNWSWRIGEEVSLLS